MVVRLLHAGYESRLRHRARRVGLGKRAGSGASVGRALLHRAVRGDPPDRDTASAAAARGGGEPREPARPELARIRQQRVLDPPAGAVYPRSVSRFLARERLAYARVQWQTGFAAGVP